MKSSYAHNKRYSEGKKRGGHDARICTMRPKAASANTQRLSIATHIHIRYTKHAADAHQGLQKQMKNSGKNSRGKYR